MVPSEVNPMLHRHKTATQPLLLYVLGWWPTLNRGVCKDSSSPALYLMFVQAPHTLAFLCYDTVTAGMRTVLYPDNIQTTTVLFVVHRLLMDPKDTMLAPFEKRSECRMYLGFIQGVFGTTINDVAASKWCPHRLQVLLKACSVKGSENEVKIS